MSKPNHRLPAVILEASPPLQPVVDLLNSVSWTLGGLETVDFEAARLMPQIQDFFENRYVKVDTKGCIRKYLPKFPVALSSPEAELLTFLLDSNYHGNPATVIGHSGVGKTTLIKYITMYLYFLHADIKDRFLPVYISMFSMSGQISDWKKSTDLISHIVDRINGHLAKPVNGYLHKSTMEALLRIREICQDHAILQKLGDKHLPNISANIDEFLAALAERQPGKHEVFMECARRAYSLFKKKAVVIFDDLDRYDYNTHRELLSLADRLIQESNYAVVLSVRQSTYKKIDYRSLEKRDHKIFMSYSIETTKQILEKSIGDAKQRTQIPVTVGKRGAATVVAETERIIRAFTSIITHGESIDLLANLSNQDLDSLYAKFPIMLHAIDKRERVVNLLAKEILVGTRPTVGKLSGLHPHFVMDLLFRNRYGTFSTDFEMVRIGLLNLFCNNIKSKFPYYYFIRCHLLARTLPAEPEREEWFPVEDIYEEYGGIMGFDMNLFSVLSRSLWRLQQAHLLYAKSCFKEYREDNALEMMIQSEESISISTCGTYYITRMIQDLNYLYYMKDDIDWFEPWEFDLAAFGDKLECKVYNTLLALNMLMNIELEMVEQVCERQEQSIRSVKMRPVFLYRDAYSARVVFPEIGTMFFTLAMLERYRRFIQQKGLTTDPDIKSALKKIEKQEKRARKMEDVL